MKKIKRIIIFIVLIFIISFGGIFIYIKSCPKLSINSAGNIALYDNKKKLFFQGNKATNWVNLNNISDNVINCTIYTEDKNFYKHHGFDFLRILKAGYINVSNGKNVQGASTITQQYAKNLFLDFDKTWKRKWDEIWYTIRIEDNYSKDEILEGYLNTINYGHGMYGIENASKFYFGKKAKDLSLAESSILVGIPKAPSIYSPLIDYKAAKKRQLLVLKELVKNKVISEEEKNKVYDEKLKFIGEKDRDNISIAMYYEDAVLDELKTINEIPKSISDTKGLKIYTSLDYNLQKELETIVKEEIPNSSKVEVSSVLMDPKTGGIKALVGGKDYNKSSYNRVTNSKRQVGSTMKPYLYYAALENGFTASSSFTSEETTFNLNNKTKYSPKNYNNKYGNKPISMATAIAYSENIYAVKTHLFLGSEALINVARRVGINSKLEDIPSLPLGTNEINIKEMTAGYASFANMGYKVKPHLIEKVEDGDGRVLYKFNKEKELVLNSSLVYILNNLLTTTYDPNYIDYNYPTAIGLNSKLKHKYALKSGTTDTDNWNIGYNKYLVGSVWVGYDNNKELKPKEYRYSQNIWYRVMEKYEENKDNEWYKLPKNVSAMFVDPISGKPISNNSSKKKLMYFIKGTEPSETDQTFDEKFSSSSAT
ncbi:MAG: PBP1A family penicillin-binding protein [Bacilli bacterium]|nr:PBP1A family penicillin-binding protein [Bacilli bacterium]MBR3049264.1 PBP1A family penicillin-binding protein [Bacilli bacterium]